MKLIRNVEPRQSPATTDLPDARHPSAIQIVRLLRLARLYSESADTHCRANPRPLSNLCVASSVDAGRPPPSAVRGIRQVPRRYGVEVAMRGNFKSTVSPSRMLAFRKK